MNTLSIKFFLKPFRDDQTKLTVFVRIIYNRTKTEFTTGIRCVKSEWNQKKERFTHSTLLNQKLYEIREKIYRAKNDLDDIGRHYEALDIKILVNGKKKANIYLNEFYDEYIAEKIEQDRCTPSTIKKYQQTHKYLKRFLKAGNKMIRVNSIDIRFINEFDAFLKNHKWNDHEERLHLTTINKHHSRLKAVLNAAIQKGYAVQNPYSNFKLAFPHSNREYLTMEELNAMKALDLSSNISLDKVRDIFLFSCYTGLRYQDAISLTMSKIIMINDQVYISLEQGKTKESREIPLIDAALSIVEKYAWSKSRMIKNLVLPTFTNQIINTYLKIIADLADIKKPLSHHIARHTCATTILLDNNVSLETVSHWLGHNSVRTTQIYAKVSHTKLSTERNRLNKLVL